MVVLTLRRFIPLLRMASTGIKLLKYLRPLGQKSITNIKHGVIAISTYHTAMKHVASADCFDDHNEWPFEQCLGYMQAVGEGYTEAYVPIVENAKHSLYRARALISTLASRSIR